MCMKTHTLKDLIPKLSGRHVLVVGDIILDEYLIGNAERMSREAPIPVLELESRQLIPGGAANPAANIVALGSYATQVGVVGSDDAAHQLHEILTQRNINISGIFTDFDRPTTLKTRIMAHMGLRFPQQVARLDRLTREAINNEMECYISSYITHQLSEVDAVLFSDYRSGLLTPTLVEKVRASAGHHAVMLTADAQGELAKYKGFTLVKCNAEEARDYLRRGISTDAEFDKAAVDLCQALQLTGAMIITRGADGITLATASADVHHIPSPQVTDVYDTVGAGDTAIAVLTLAISAGLSYIDAAMLANYASGLVVRRVGNYAPTPEELWQAIESTRD